jgi:hypothetical protein
VEVFRINEHENRSVGKFFTELLAQTGVAIFKNQRHDQVATRIPLNGTVDDIKTATWPSVLGVLRNAYIEAFKGEFDNSITIKDALQSFKEDFKVKRAEKKAERKQERAERKQERKEKREERKAERKKDK